VLIALAQRAQEAVRAQDVVGRFGGEEFVLLLVETDLSGAHMLAERLRRCIADAAIETPDGVMHLTASIGITLAQSEGDTVESCLARADRAMYDAKEAGGNRSVVVIPPAS